MMRFAWRAPYLIETHVQLSLEFGQPDYGHSGPYFARLPLLTLG